MDWSPASWRSHEALQQPCYEDGDALAAAERELSAYPPLVAPTDTDSLKRALADAQRGGAFVLQGGDCAESFAEFSPANIRSTHRLFSRMAEVLGRACRLPIVRVGRLAGQFAKPRSRDVEERPEAALPVYRGDIVNGIAFDAAARRPDPDRMFRAYAQSAATLAHLRELAEEEGSSFYTSHEALLLPFEQALVRGRYASSAHFLWVGDRTRFEGSAHVEFARGIANPIGIKCGPSLDPDRLIRLLDILNPAREDGRITLISRMGAGKVELVLPPLLRAVRRDGHPVLWSCDPMHGNTVRSGAGYKTRPLGRIFDEVRGFFGAVRAEGAVPGGIHVEMTGRDVTECTGGADRLTEEDLSNRYHTHCDPRLNAAQAIELADLLAGLLKQQAEGAEAA